MTTPGGEYLSPADDSAGERDGGARQIAITTWILALVLAAFVLPPLALLIKGSVTGTDGGLTLRYFQRVFEDKRLLESSFNSVLFAFGSAAVALVFGGAIAWIVE